MIMMQIMLRDRKYLHVELIGLRVCSQSLLLSLLSEIASKLCRDRTPPLSGYSGYHDLMVTEVRARLHGKVLRECFKCKRNCKKNYIWKEAKERRRGGLSQCTHIQFNAQGTQCAEWIIPSQSQISLYRSNSAAATTTSARQRPRVPRERELYPGSFHPSRRALASLPDAARSRVPEHVPVHVHAHVHVA